MSDLTYEQMKTLFENLQDRLDKTAGDKLSFDELERIRDVLEKTQKALARSQASNNPRAVMDEFFRRWNNSGKGSGTGSASGKGKKKDSDESSPGQTYIERKRKERGDAEQEAGERTKKASKESETGIKRFSSGVSGLGSHLDRAGTKIAGFVDNLQKGALGGLSGGALGKILGAVDDRAEGYRSMIASGNGQFRTIAQMSNAVNDAHMSIQELAGAMEKSQGARMVGAADYAKLTGAVTKQTLATGNMGLNFEQRQEAQQAYLEMMVSQGRMRSLSESDMVSGIKSLVKSSESTANILGLTRSEALKARAEQAANPDLATLLKARGASQATSDSMLDASTDIEKGMGAKYNKMFQQLYATGSVKGEAAELAATDQSAFQMLSKFAAQAKAGGVIDQKALAAAMKNYGNSTAGSKLNETKAMYNTLGAGPESFRDATAAGIRTTQLGSGEVPEHVNNDGDKAMLNAQEALRASASALREGFDTLLNTISREYGPSLLKVVQGTIDMAGKMQSWIRGFQAFPEFTSKIGLAIIGVVGLTTVVGGAAKVLGFFRGTIGSILSIFGKGGGAAGAGRGAAGRGAAGAAGAGAAGAGAGAAGRTFKTRALERLRGAAGAAEGAGAGGIARGLMRGVGKNALIGTAFESLDYLTGAKQLSLKNLAKSGLKVGGGALGGTLGSLLGPVGTFAGGAGGYMAGDWLGNKIFGDDDVASKSAAGTPAKPKPVSRPNAQGVNKPASDATGSRGKNALTMDQMSLRIMNAQELAVSHLKSIRENSETLNNLIREEIVMTKTFGERTVRLLEETSKNTRMIADNAV